MIKRTLKQLAAMAGGTVETAYENIKVEGVAIDSRAIEHDMLFIPFKGERTDGHRYVEQVINSGAAASFWQRDVAGAPDLPLIKVDDCLAALQQLSRSYLKEVSPKVIGITGSNGKTSTKDMVAGVLTSEFKVKKTIGNYNNEIGLPLTICQLDQDTEISILEMGMSGFREIAFLSNLAEPDIAVITNIGESHMQDLGSREGIARAKFEITEGLDGLLIYDGDEPLLAPLAETYKGEKMAIGFEQENNSRISRLENIETGIRFQLSPESTVFDVPVLGAHNARNASIAVAIGRHLGLTEQTIQQNLQQLKMTSMRMEKLAGPAGSTLINDAYNASPTSMKAAIDTLDSIEGKKYIILADVLELGPDSEQYHREVGRYIKDRDMTVLTTGNEAYYIYDEAKRTTKAQHFTNRDELTDFLKARLDQHSTALFKGSRGMKLEEIIENILK